MWFYEHDGIRCGPVDSTQLEQLLRSGEIDEATLVRRADEMNWHHLDETDLIWLVQDIADEEDSLDNIDEFAEEEPEPETPLEVMIAAGERIWFYMLEDRVYGPVTTDEIVAIRVQGEIDGQTSISEGDAEHWRLFDETDLVNITPST